jgi:hypothetical protein
MAKAKVTVCAACGESKDVKARGLCATCYKRNWRAEQKAAASSRRRRRAAKKPRTAAAAEAPMEGAPARARERRAAKPASNGPAILVTFAGYPELWALLERLAAEELRTVEQQILWELARAVEA